VSASGAVDGDLAHPIVLRKSLASQSISVIPLLSSPSASRTHGHPPCPRQESACQDGRSETARCRGTPIKAGFEQLGEAHALPKKQAHALLADFVVAVRTHLKAGARLRMSGLGILEVKSREARMGRNPATGAVIQIKASRKVGFRPSKELKDAL
jgi:DNA-binding protein HU-beta